LRSKGDTSVVTPTSLRHSATNLSDA
jgi:hypothetical protein